MSKNRYKEWLESQDKDFIEEVHGTNYTDKFKHRVPRSCTLEELKRLDNKYINAEGDLKE